MSSALTVLPEDPPACDIAAGPRGEGVRGGGYAHRLHQVIEEDRSAELQKGDVVVGGELVVLWVQEDSPDRSRGCSVDPHGHHAHSHLGPPRTGV